MDKKKIEELILKSAQAEDDVMTRVVADMLGHKAEEEPGKVSAAVEAIKQFLAEHGRDVAAGAAPLVGAGLGAGIAGKGRRLMGAGIGAGVGAGGALAIQPKIGIAVLRKLRKATGLTRKDRMTPLDPANEYDANARLNPVNAEVIRSIQDLEDTVDAGDVFSGLVPKSQG